MDPVTLKNTLKEGGRVYGCMLSAMASTRFSSVLKGSTLDYVIIDTEHGSRDRTEIQTLCAMLHNIGITPVVRVPVPKAEWVAMALDAGAAGVLVPYCETVEEVSACVATAKWHPLKGEYLKRAIEKDELPSEASREYLESRHKQTFVVIGIESVPAHENLESILDVGSIDGIFIGPNDLSTSIGIPNQYDDSRYKEAVADIIRRSELRNIPVMVHQQTFETSTMAMQLGARFVLHAMDSNIMQRALQREFNELRGFAGAELKATDNTVDVA
ncbi:MAG: HpcH/HpaI aldolase/citrate lyase family protein [Pseudomonadota bacterium]